MFKRVFSGLLVLVLVGGAAAAVRGEENPEPAAGASEKSGGPAKPERPSGGDKRDEMVNAWMVMAEAIRIVSVNLGTPISADTFDFNNCDGAKLARAMRGLIWQSKTVVSQRDGLAAALQEIGNLVRMKNAPSAERLIAESRIPEGGELKGSAAVARHVAMTVERCDAAQEEVRTLRNLLAEVGAIVGARSRRGTDVVRAAERRTREFRELREELSKTRQQLTASITEAARAERALAEYKRELADLRREKAELQSEIARIKEDYKAVTDTEYGAISPWKPGSPEARAHVVGKVTKVDLRNGYIVFDIGTGTRAVQKIGTREIKVDPRFHEGMELVVVRGGMDGSAAPKFITRIRISSIDEHFSVANIARDTTILEGDFVIDNALYDSGNAR